MDDLKGQTLEGLNLGRCSTARCRARIPTGINVCANRKNLCCHPDRQREPQAALFFSGEKIHILMVKILEILENI